MGLVNNAIILRFAFRRASGTISLRVTMASAQAKQRETLPSPDQRPEADVVIYDGRCRICTSQVRRLAKFDRGGRLAYLSLHDPLVAARYPDLNYEQLMEQMYVVDGQGRRHGGAAAVRYLTRRLPRLWWAAPVLNFPGTMPLWSFLYRQIAKRRYKLSGGEACDEDGTCSLHAK